MEMAGVALAIPGIIDVLIRGGQFIVEKVDTFQKIDQTLDTYRQLGLDLSNGVLSYHLEALQQASRNCIIPAAFQQRLESSLRRSEDTLSKARKELAKVKANSRTGKLIYTFWGEHQLQNKYTSFKTELGELDKLCSQLHELQSVPPSSFLRPEYFKLVHETADNQPGKILPVSDIFIANGNYQSNTGRITGMFVLEKKYREIDIRLLCSKLMGSSPAEGFLKCLGYRQPPYNEEEPPNRPYFQLVMELPDYPCRSLAYRIDCEVPPLLSVRLEYAKRLTRAVCHVHGIGLVHKSIRPRAILLVRPAGTPVTAEQIYLQDWTYVRETTGATSQLGGDHSWQREIYQHPNRQGRPGHYPEVAYEVNHDLYSLGVTLLELFLWTPFIERTDRQDLNSPLKISRLFEDRALSLGEGNGGMPSRYTGNTEKLASRPVVTRNIWIDIASHELADIHHGLSQIVLSCLSGHSATAAGVLGALCKIES